MEGPFGVDTPIVAPPISGRVPVLLDIYNSSGGVENTRLKAKDTKKISRPRPRTDPLEAKDQGHRRKCSPKNKNKKGPQKFFKAISKKGLQKSFSGEKGLQFFFFRRSLLEETKKRSLQIFRKVSGVFQRNFNVSKIVLSSSRGQGNFRGLKASRPRPRTSKCVLEDVLEDSTSV